jgi:hypothetical protein
METRLFLAKLNRFLKKDPAIALPKEESDDLVELREARSVSPSSVEEEKEFESENSTKIKILDSSYGVRFNDRISMWYFEKGGRTICTSISIYASVLLLCYLATYKGSAIHISYGNRHHSIDAFMSTILVFIGVGVLTMRNDKDSLEDKNLSLIFLLQE